MKPRFVLAFLAVFLVVNLSSCRKLLTFDIGITSSFSIPSTLLLDVPLNIATPDVTTNSTQEFEQNDTKAKYVDEIYLTQLKLHVTNPSNQTFSPLKHIYIFISADGLSEQRVAYYENIPPNTGQELLLNIDDTDLADFIKKDKFNLRVQAVTDETFFSNISITADMNYRVKAKNPVFGS